MGERVRCLSCGHTWQVRAGTPVAAQCPGCRRHRTIDAEVFENAVLDLVRLLRKPSTDPLEEFSRALDHARTITQATFPDPILGGQAAFEIVREAVARLGFPPLPRP